MPRPAFSVRRAAATDVERLADVHIQCWQETYREMLSDALLAAADREGRLVLWRHLLDRPDPAEAWVACDGDTVVGFAGIRSVPAPESGPLELWGLYLLASHQGLGLGGQLLGTALGTQAASLWVAAGNSRAIGFYRRFGFEPDGAEDTLADWEDLPEIRMVRPVQPAA